MKTRLAQICSALSSILLSVSSQTSALAGVTEDLGNQIDQEKAGLTRDYDELQNEYLRYSSRAEEQQNIIQLNQQWIQQQDLQAKSNKDKLNSLEAKIKQPAQLKKMLNTPGTELYDLNKWFQTEAAGRARAQYNIANAQSQLKLLQMDMGQNRSHVANEEAKVARDAENFNNRLTNHPGLNSHYSPTSPSAPPGDYIPKLPSGAYIPATQPDLDWSYYHSHWGHTDRWGR